MRLMLMELMVMETDSAIAMVIVMVVTKAMMVAIMVIIMSSLGNMRLGFNF